MDRKLRRALMWIGLLTAAAGITLIIVSMVNGGNAVLTAGLACVVIGQIISFVLNSRRNKNDDK